MFQAEIDGRQTTFKSLKEEGQKLKCEEDLLRLEELRSTLSRAWEERRLRLSQAHQLQAFRQQADIADSWLANKLAYLNNDDLGVRPHYLSIKKTLFCFTCFTTSYISSF